MSVAKEMSELLEGQKMSSRSVDWLADEVEERGRMLAGAMGSGNPAKAGIQWAKLRAAYLAWVDKKDDASVTRRYHARLDRELG